MPVFTDNRHRKLHFVLKIAGFQGQRRRVPGRTLAFAVDILVVGAGLDAHAATVLAASDTVVRTVVRGIGVILPGEDFDGLVYRILPGKEQGLLVFVEALA